MAINTQKLQAIKAEATQAQSKLGTIGESVLTILLPSIEALFTASLIDLFETFHTKNPQGHEAALIGIYPPIDVHLETLVGKTKTKFDDAFVRIFKKALEGSAEINDIKLPNLDKD